MYKSLFLCLFTGLLFVACAQTGTFSPSDAQFSDGNPVCSDPSGDWDKDGIPNGTESCFSEIDTDLDGTPDWRDLDSDADGILDETEKGNQDGNGKCASAFAASNEWPCDTDGDGNPDYLDEDSDNDNVADKDEDSNGDGLLGCCLTECNKPDTYWQLANCSLEADGCGPGQQCQNGQCIPAVAFNCSNGETNPLKQDTFNDGRKDHERGTFICRDATEDKPQGRKPIQTRSNATGNWNVALEMDAKYGEYTINNPASKEVAAAIDHDGNQTEVAGFVVSRPTTASTIQEEANNIIDRFNTNPATGVASISVRASGVQATSHDGYDSIRATILDISLSAAYDVSTARNVIVGIMLGRPISELGNLPTQYGSNTTAIVVRFVTVRRIDLKNPGDQSQWHLVIMGSVASKNNYQEPTRPTGFIVDDLSNGTSLATASDSVVNECDVGIIDKLPIADIIWVVDESGSMSDNRDDIVANATDFFSRALASGLDFRMAVTGVVNPNSYYKNTIGKFCSQASNSPYDDGGVDRFLLPSEQSIFSACVKNPPGYEGGSEYGLLNAKTAVNNHLPRTANSPSKIRPEATLVIIVATDEIPNSLSSAIGGNRKQCTLPATNQTQLNAGIQEYLQLFTGTSNPEAAAIFHVIGGVCQNKCNADVTHGYNELAQALGGQLGDVCQANLGSTLQVIIDSIIGAASPVVLEYIPISTSLAVALNGKQIQRSRISGFDYREAANTIAFMNVTFEPGAEVVVSYKRWKQQGVIE